MVKAAENGADSPHVRAHRQALVMAQKKKAGHLVGNPLESLDVLFGA
jgi:hypothetical protein